MSSKLMSATMNADKHSDVASPQKLQFGYQGSSNNAAMLSPKTEGEPPKMQGLIDGNQPTDQKTEPGGYAVGGESTTDAQSVGQLDHDPSRLSNAFGAQH